MAQHPGFRMVRREGPTNDACEICTAPTESWSIQAFVVDIPVGVVCADCAIKILDLTLEQLGSLDIPPEQRLATAKLIKARATKDLETEHVTGTLRRLLS